jgi:hypothetical protein
MGVMNRTRLRIKGATPDRNPGTPHTRQLSFPAVPGCRGRRRQTHKWLDNVIGVKMGQGGGPGVTPEHRAREAGKHVPIPLPGHVASGCIAILLKHVHLKSPYRTITTPRTQFYFSLLSHLVANIGSRRLDLLSTIVLLVFLQSVGIVTKHL